MERPIRSARDTWRSALVAAALVACAAAAAARPAAPLDEPSAAGRQVADERPDPAAEALRARVAELLVEVVPGDREQATAQVAALARLGQAALPALFDALAQGRITLVEEGEPDRSVPITPDMTRVLLASLARLPRPALFQHLRAVGETRPTPLERERAVLLVGTLGTASELELLLELALPGDSKKRLGLGTGRALRDSVEGILRRDPKAYARLRSLVPRSDPRLATWIVSGVGRTGTVEALELLAGLLSGEPGVDRLILNQLSGIALTLPGPFEPHVQELVRAALRSDDAGVRGEAAVTVAHLEDHEAVGALIAMLADRDSGCVANAHWALVTLTGHHLRPEPVRWRTWHQEERAWWRDRAPELFEDLAYGTPTQAAAAINEISSRRASRHQLAGELVLALSHPAPGVRRAACEALGQLRSKVALPALLEALETEDEPVHEAAWRALEAITGLDLPPEPEVWRGVLRDLD